MAADQRVRRREAGVVAYATDVSMIVFLLVPLCLVRATSRVRCPGVNIRRRGLRSIAQ